MYEKKKRGLITVCEYRKIMYRSGQGEFVVSARDWGTRKSVIAVWKRFYDESSFLWQVVWWCEQ